MRTSRYLLLIILSLTVLLGKAQDVVVTISPVQQVLPPQLMLYFDNPGRFFNVTLTNTSVQPQEVYLALHIEQQMPASGLFVTTPVKRQPTKPITVPANGTKQLTPIELKTLFNHVPSAEIQATPGIIGKFNDGSFGLLPEGEYMARLVAYKWAMPQLRVPVAVSNPEMSSTNFTICYNAQAPRFVMPMEDVMTLDNSGVADLDVMNPLFTWTPPVATCNVAANRFEYDFKVVEVMKGQRPDDAIERNPVVYNVKGLSVPQCIIPRMVIQTRMYTDRTYAAQVTARPVSANILNFVMVENDGKSTFRQFRLDTGEIPPVEEEKKGDKQEDKKEEDEEERNQREMDLEWDDFDMDAVLTSDSLFTFSFPKITRPFMVENNGCRKMLVNQEFPVEWEAPNILEARAGRADTIKIEYDVELFCSQSFGMENAMSGEPIYRKHVKELNDSIPYDEIAEHVEVGNYLVLRVNPVAKKGQSVAFVGEKTHIKDFALCDVISKKYFQCSNQIEIVNKTPTKKSARDLKGKVVHIGEYDLTIDNIMEGTKPGTWKGDGHVLWEPMGIRTHVCVKFDELKINTDDYVFEGTCSSYSRQPEQSSIATVDKLFSDWGIDNLIGDTQIPYASELQNAANGVVKDIAKQVDLAKYYSYVRTGEAILDDFLSGEVKDLYLPLSLPKSINKSPVDLQIVSMKFSPTYATMDVLGEFTLPNSRYTKNDILVFGAPRLCISPNQVLPESGTVALLSDFTIVDPKSTYEMTFKAPEDLLQPKNGCFISWHDYKFEMLDIDIDMKIPGLVKDVNGVATTEAPIFNAQTRIDNWNNWFARITVDPFQVESLPGYTFTATEIVYDHSYMENSPKMGDFPKGFNKEKAGVTGYVVGDDGKVYAPVDSDGDWTGLYIKEIGIKFPGALEFGTEDDKRLSITAHDMFFDKSGATLSVTGENLLSAKTGKAGGWAFSLDEVNLDVLQNDFNGCNFSGKFAVPLLKGEVGYRCDIRRMGVSAKGEGQYAYIFKTKQVDNLSLDFLLARADFDPEQTYFLLESVPEKGVQNTSCELMMGGDLTIGGVEYLANKVKSGLKLDFELRGIHFCGMRISNRDSKWESKFESGMQKTARDGKSGKIKLFTAEDLQFGSCYLNMGRWSLASSEKSLGGFSFTLDTFKFDRKDDDLELEIDGSVSLVSDVSITAGTGLTIVGNVKMPKDLSDISNIDLSYKTTRFKEFRILAEFAGMKLDGRLEASNDKDKKGASGTVLFSMPGDLFSVNASGGYYKTGEGDKAFSYGWFYAKMQSSAGIQVPPIAINGITAGFYFNCSKDGESAKPKKGVIGVIAGLTLSSTAGEKALSADGDLTVVYDREHNRLSTFILNGNVKALDGLVSAKCNLVYEHSDNDKYMELDVTVDAKADSEKLIEKYDSEFAGLNSLKKQLDSNYKSIMPNNPEGGLGSLTDQQGTPEKSKAPEKGESLSASAEATISLNLKLTWMEKGVEYSPIHWHLYIGEPELDKRCKFTFLKFKSPIVSVDIGANAYLCFGNELPGNGKLPNIPSKIADFLNGKAGNEGVESASLSDAKRARQASIEEFNQQALSSNEGGIMFGAQVYGYFNVDLGLFYLNAGATAGFDLSLVKGKATCTNIDGKPGFADGWYGYGQLYAYLYANLGIRIDLGFWSDSFDFANAEIGGLFSMQGPKPSHFEGKARVKLKLLGGLVNIDRKFAFECGQGCDLFYGNALDDFKLFGDLSIGYDNADQGFLESNAINPQLLQRPHFTTEAPLNEHFRVIDETEKARLKKTYVGNSADLDMEASRTFVFHSDVKTNRSVTLLEFNKRPQWVRKTGGASTRATYGWSERSTKRTFQLKGQDRLNNFIDVTLLNPNKYYILELTGYAKEIQYGKEVDPLKFNVEKNKYENVAWTQTKTYYFRTGNAAVIPDNPANLDDYVAIAYPSHKNKLKPDEDAGYVKAYASDVRKPNIAFYRDLSRTVFQKGKLYWRLYYKYRDTMRKACEVPAKWLVTDSTCNLTSEYYLTGFAAGSKYRLKLEYEHAKGGAKIKYAGQQVEYITDTIADIPVDVVTGDWGSGNGGVSLAYEKPFVGARIDKVQYADNAQVDDYNLASENGSTRLRLTSPYWYIGYLSNYAFAGGWEFTQDRLDINITTAQSLIYTDKGGVYEGALSSATRKMNTMKDIDKIKGLSVYGPSQYASITPYPLLDMDDPEYNYVLSGQRRACDYKPSPTYYKRVMSYIDDMFMPYYVCESLCTTLNSTAKQIDKIDEKYSKLDTKISEMEKWYKGKRGQYIRASFQHTVMEVPAYQFPILWGGALTNSKAKKSLTMWGTLKGYYDADHSHSDARGHERNAEMVYINFLGSAGIHSDLIDNYKRYWARDNYLTNRTTDNIQYAVFTCYRCNSYNFKECRYVPITGLADSPITTFRVDKPLNQSTYKYK